MRETITFPRPYHRSLKSVLLVAFVGALLLVLALPVSIHAERKLQPITTPNAAARDHPQRDSIPPATIGPRP
jgi:hypothetical protein